MTVLPNNACDCESLKGVLQSTKCFVLDMDGTIYLEDSLFPFTAEFLRAVTASGRSYVFFTNNSSKRRADYVDKLARLGLPHPASQMLHANQVLLSHLRREYPGKSVYLVGTPSLEAEFRDAGVMLTSDNPDLVILGFDTSLTYEKLWKACNFVRNGCTYLGVNMDYNCPVEGGFMPDCGSIAEAVRRSTGRIPEFFGKPSRHTLDYVREQTGFAEPELTFIGDRLYTDIAVANGTKAHSILVLTGETQPGDLEASEFRPNAVANSLEELTYLLQTGI